MLGVAADGGPGQNFVDIGVRSKVIDKDIKDDKREINIYKPCPKGT